LGAKELGPDVIIFRSDDKLYLVEDKAKSARDETHTGRD
jgi:hypothetical protein